VNLSLQYCPSAPKTLNLLSTFSAKESLQNSTRPTTQCESDHKGWNRLLYLEITRTRIDNRIVVSKVNMGLEHPYHRHHSHDVRNTNQHLDAHHMLINGRQRTFVPSSNLFSFYQVQLRRLQHTVGSNCERHNNFVCLKPRFCAFAIGTQTKHMQKLKQMRNCQRRKEMIETNTWQKPSACDTSSRSKRETTICKKTLLLGYTHVSFHFVSDPLPFAARQLGHANEAFHLRPYAVCVDRRGFLRKP
jgi:hypothetical protein